MHAEFQDLWVGLDQAVQALGLSSDLDQPGGTGVIEGVPVVVRSRAVPNVSDVAAFAQLQVPGRYKILLGRRVSAEVRRELDSYGIGYFDGRGRLRIWHRPLFVDAEVPKVGGAPTGRHAPDFAVASTVDVALAVLCGDVREGVRASAPTIGRAPSTVSKQLVLLRDAHLVDDRNEPVVPDLFEAMLQEWRPVRLPLGELPRPSGGAVDERLQFGLDDRAERGWVLAEVAAARAWGAPVVTTSDPPPDFYVPDSAVAGLARTLLGQSEFGQHACTVAVAPSPLVCRLRYPRGELFPAPSPVVAALDLAADPSRGREILELWSRHLDPEIRRVW